ncbi:type II and III secretion system protein family protein [Novosphingobium mangrovi (ex Huang et al. 2023)]|uniref:Type II and III secretion system protein family protein n=1 Tax=Novosphingobium mangrovi (ex Huang et al. 2023) TaxID=2976432 RepID=A0ABT2I4D4_9SPHN|nr:type II and III secretion system protein family protein [Novosphingobium mangrovi (ex Huang et al. 2023)]MCT2399659.1 type II and III secretion system protein family protein [Novosphingobium mangrovi (ex Huang et al. 2023)]
MKPRLLKTMMTAACALAPLAVTVSAPVTAQSVQRPAQSIDLSIGNGQLVNVPGSMTDVFVANDQVADVQVKSRSQFYVFGKAGGTTTVYASNAAGKVVWSGTITVGSNLDSVDSMLSLAMPEAKIGVSTMGSNTFLLTGTVKTPEDVSEAERLVQAYVGDKANVISRLRMATPLQVNLQVRIAEVSRSLVKSLSSNLTTIDGTGGFKFGIGQGREFYNTFATDPNLPLGMGSAVQGYTYDPITGNIVLKPGTNVLPLTGSSTLSGMGKLFGLNILGALDAGETVGLVTTLAQPNLTALSGETADFLAGGEYPIPVSQGLGAQSIEYKKYGVSLSYTPTVLANGRISMRVRPEVSELSSQGSVNLNGYEVPALTVRRTETTIELGSGQSFMIAGLLSSNTQNNIQKMPGAGDLPILGSLFRSTSYKRGETELVIVVTPYLVNPVDASQIALPTDGFNSPNELQRLLGNMENDGVSGAKRPGPTQAPAPVDGPSVGAADIPAKPSKGKASKHTASNDSAKPGFSLK